MAAPRSVISSPSECDQADATQGSLAVCAARVPFEVGSAAEGSVSLAGAAVRYHTVGSGSEHVLFVHGLGGNRRCWHRAPGYFEKGRYTLIFPDLPGFGVSEGPSDGVYSMERFSDAVAAILDGLGVESAHLVTHSMGSIPALLLSASRPGLVRSIVVAEGSLAPENSGMSKRICRLTESSFSRVYSKWLGLVEASLGAEAPDQHAHFVDSLRTLSPTSLHRAATSCLQWTQSAEPSRILAALERPRAYVAGELSFEGRGIPAIVEQLRIDRLVVEGQAHFMMESADCFYPWIEAWLRRVTGGRP